MKMVSAATFVTLTVTLILKVSRISVFLRESLIENVPLYTHDTI